MKLGLDENWQIWTEYALILILIVVVLITAITVAGPLVSKIFSTINSNH